MNIVLPCLQKGIHAAHVVHFGDVFHGDVLGIVDDKMRCLTVLPTETSDKITNTNNSKKKNNWNPKDPTWCRKKLETKQKAAPIFRGFPKRHLLRKYLESRPLPPTKPSFKKTRNTLRIIVPCWNVEQEKRLDFFNFYRGYPWLGLSVVCLYGDCNLLTFMQSAHFLLWPCRTFKRAASLQLPIFVGSQVVSSQLKIWYT